MIEAIVIVQDSLDIFSMAFFETLVPAPAALVRSKLNGDVDGQFVLSLRTWKESELSISFRLDS